MRITHGIWLASPVYTWKSMTNPIYPTHDLTRSKDFGIILIVSVSFLACKEPVFCRLKKRVYTHFLKKLLSAWMADSGFFIFSKEATTWKRI